MTVAFDLDGCLVENHNDWTIYGRNDPAPLMGVRIRQRVAGIARKAIADGYLVVVITGRQRGVRAASIHTLARIFNGYELGVHYILADMDDDEKWAHDRAIAHKVDNLIAWNPRVFFGDRADFDGVAADRALIPFIHTPADDPRWD